MKNPATGEYSSPFSLRVSMDTARCWPSAKSQLMIVCAIPGAPQYDMKRSTPESLREIEGAGLPVLREVGLAPVVEIAEVLDGHSVAVEVDVRRARDVGLPVAVVPRLHAAPPEREHGEEHDERRECPAERSHGNEHAEATSTSAAASPSASSAGRGPVKCNAAAAQTSARTTTKPNATQPKRRIRRRSPLATRVSKAYECRTPLPPRGSPVERRFRYQTRAAPQPYSVARCRNAAPPVWISTLLCVTSVATGSCAVPPGARPESPGTSVR